jgi:cytoplasmic iron level regulating protein YaaA (DUF328/UPF0246 family)
MIVLLSPAKDLSLEAAPMKGTTEPALLEHVIPVAEKMRSMSAKKLASLLHISPKLAQLNHDRYQQWEAVPKKNIQLPAAFMFNGEAYRGLKARTLSPADLQFAQHHVRILSGLYGILRPLDLIQPYRLMMGVKVSPARGKKDLYAWWTDRITTELEKVLKKSGSKVIINLASDEYFKAVDAEALGAEVITPIFKDKHAGAYKMLTVFFKNQRGAMTRHIIQNRILDPRLLKEYTGDGYYFSEEDSTANEWIFLRDKRPG